MSKKEAIGTGMEGKLGGSFSNIQAFIDITTPVVKSHSKPKSYFQGLNTFWHSAVGKDIVDYFDMSDLWDFYEEGSIYGVGVPLHLHNGDAVVQYYVPYLSSIQIFTSKAYVSSRNGTEDSESESWTDDSESEKLSRSWDGVSDDSGLEPEVSCLPTDCFGDLYFEFFDDSFPHLRIPLQEQIYQFAESYPGLRSFKSIEVSPASWMSVAWYPIYHIPNNNNLKDMSTAFLTYHTLSSSLLDHMPGGAQNDVCCAVTRRPGSKELRKCISLSPFGLASHKMQRNLWINRETGDEEKLASLFGAADSWVKQLKVHHPDLFHFKNIWRNIISGL